MWGEERDPEPGRLDGPDFNREIRTALGDALSGALDGQDVKVDAWWFADTAGDGIDTPDGIPLPIQTHGRLPSTGPRGLRDVFSACSYSPGLDLWDPVEGALGAALDRLECEPTGRPGVLIVGNSPPNVPSESSSPIRKLVHALGYPTSFRRGFSPHWHAELRRADRLEIRLVYLFLTHSMTDPGPAAMQKDYVRFVNLSEQVREALEACLPVVVAEADAEGVARGVQEALRILASPRSLSSRVEVRA